MSRTSLHIDACSAPKSSIRSFCVIDARRGICCLMRQRPALTVAFDPIHLASYKRSLVYLGLNACAILCIADDGVHGLLHNSMQSTSGGRGATT